MIHSATQTSKFRKLVRRLRSLVSSDIVEVETIAVGLLERLWHATMQEAKQGDIGRHDNETIADMMGWIALDCDQLIEILVETGWLDRSIEHRLLVHDWAEHCPAFIKKNISRWGGFLTPNDPHLSQLAATKRSSEPVSGDKTAQLSQLASTPNQTQPNQTQPNQIQPNQTKINQTKPNQTQPNQTHPNHTKLTQNIPNKIKSNHIKLKLDGVSPADRRPFPMQLHL